MDQFDGELLDQSKTRASARSFEVAEVKNIGQDEQSLFILS